MNIPKIEYEYIKKVIELVATEIDRRADQIADILVDLIHFRSVNPYLSGEPSEELACQSYIASILEKIGYRVKLWEPNPKKLSEKYSGTPGFVPGHLFEGRPNLIANSAEDTSGPAILLTGHVDVVPANEEGWEYPPFDGVVRDGKIYGRGAVDMKGGLAAMLGALQAIAVAGIDTPGQIWFSSVVDEEAGGMGALALVEHILEEQLQIGGAILGEPTDLGLAPISRGILWGEIVVKGKSGHIEVRQPYWENGGAVDAIKKMGKVCKAIEWLNEEWEKSPGKSHPLLPRPCRIEIAQIVGGHSPTSFADNCKIIINVQYLPAERDEVGGGGKVRREIESFIAAVTRSDSWLLNNPPEFRWLIDADSYEISSTDSFVKLCQQGLSLAGITPKLQGVETHTDAGRLGYDAKIPTVIMGPGNMRLAHQVNEYLAVEELCKAAKAYAAIVLLSLFRPSIRN